MACRQDDAALSITYPTARSAAMRSIIYIIGLIVVVMFVLSLLGLR